MPAGGNTPVIVPRVRRGRRYNREKLPAAGREGRTFGTAKIALPNAEKIARECGVSERTIHYDASPGNG